MSSQNSFYVLRIFNHILHDSNLQERKLNNTEFTKVNGVLEIGLELCNFVPNYPVPRVTSC